jgi:3-phosphoshikimate 1-carboxyvinyltransferase
MLRTIQPSGPLTGALILPGDKSISHRYAILASIAEGTSVIRNYSTGADCHSTLGAVKALGVAVELEGTTVTVRGKGLDGWSSPVGDIDAGNSGSLIRMMAGVLAAQPFTTRVTGDESLSGRPMGRIIDPLTKMGATFEAREGKYPPLVIHGAPLKAIDYTLPVASAQVKTCVLFAGLYADGETIVREPVRSRDHTELALREFGADISAVNRVITLKSRPALVGRELMVPSDISSAAFFLVAALLVPGSDLTIRGVGLNPTRSMLLDFLIGAGAKITVSSLEQMNGEMIGDIRVKYSEIKGGVLEKDMAAALIDEVPVLAVLGAASSEGLLVKDAKELRVKETDRIATTAGNLRKMGVTVEEFEDGMRITGGSKFHAATMDSFGDHRIAMAFAVASLRADGPCHIEGAEAASVSFPEFYSLLETAVPSATY